MSPSGSVQTTVELQAADTERGMTLDEVAALVQQAMREGLPGDAIVRIDVTWRSSIKRAVITGEIEEAR